MFLQMTARILMNSVDPNKLKIGGLYKARRSNKVYLFLGKLPSDGSTWPTTYQFLGPLGKVSAVAGQVEDVLLDPNDDEDEDGTQ